VAGANGQPVPDDSVDFTASAGTVPAAVQTNASGQATATYTAGTTPGSVNISGTEVIDSASGSTTVSLTAPGYTYTGTWDGQTVTLTRVTNVTVEGLPDETLLPAQLDNFQTNDPEYTALNGENINVFTAPTEFPGVDVVHNGLMGTQSVYGTWTFTPPSSGATVAALRIDESWFLKHAQTCAGRCKRVPLPLTKRGGSVTGFSC
jgi:hypothetical protein